MVRIGLCCHGILQAGFQSMFSKTTGRKTDARPTRDILRALAIDDANDADGCNTDQNLAVPDGSESPFVFPDVPVQKVQGVRANKSETWLRRPTTVAEVITAISTTEPVFRLSTWYLQQQESEGWLSSNPDMRPLVNLVTRQYSPVTKAISQCLAALREPFDVDHGPLFLLDGFLIAIHCCSLPEGTFLTDYTVTVRKTSLQPSYVTAGSLEHVNHSYVLYYLNCYSLNYNCFLNIYYIIIYWYWHWFILYLAKLCYCCVFAAPCFLNNV